MVRIETDEKGYKFTDDLIRREYGDTARLRPKDFKDFGIVESDNPKYAYQVPAIGIIVIELTNFQQSK